MLTLLSFKRLIYSLNINSVHHVYRFQDRLMGHPKMECLQSYLTTNSRFPRNKLYDPNISSLSIRMVGFISLIPKPYRMNPTTRSIQCRNHYDLE